MLLRVRTTLPSHEGPRGEGRQALGNNVLGIGIHPLQPLPSVKWKPGNGIILYMTVQKRKIKCPCLTHDHNKLKNMSSEEPIMMVISQFLLCSIYLSSEELKHLPERT